MNVDTVNAIAASANKIAERVVAGVGDPGEIRPSRGSREESVAKAVVQLAALVGALAEAVLAE